MVTCKTKVDILRHSGAASASLGRLKLLAISSCFFLGEKSWGRSFFPESIRVNIYPDILWTSII